VEEKSIIMNTTIYCHAAAYENFIRKAFRCEKNINTPAHQCHYHELYYLECGMRRSNMTYERQLDKLVFYISEAIDKFLSRRLLKEEKQALLKMKGMLVAVSTEEELYSIIDTCNQLTHRFNVSGLNGKVTIPNK
jgi:hypothetical protein